MDRGGILCKILEAVSYTHLDVYKRQALYLSTFEATKKWSMPIRNWGQVYGELSIMYEGRLPE